jgi:hypothetical protein
MRDLHNNIHPVPVLAPAATAVADNTAQVGSIVDHQGYDSAEYVIITGTLADAGATFTVLLEEGAIANLSDAATPSPMPICSARKRSPPSSNPTTANASSSAIVGQSATRA